MTILEFWFGEIQDGWTVEDRNALWFGGRADDDREIICLFSVALEEALAGGKTWETPKEALVKIILLDQMTRAAYRGTPQAFAGDPQALAICKEGLAMRWDNELPVICRKFFYLPLEHSENLADQEHSVVLFAGLRQSLAVRAKELDFAYDYAVKHRDIIAQFGRFPHEKRDFGQKIHGDRGGLSGDNPRTLWAGKSVTGITNEPTFRLV